MFDVDKAVGRFVTVVGRVWFVGLVTLLVSWAMHWETPTMVGIYLVAISGWLLLALPVALFLVWLWKQPWTAR